MIGTLTNNWNSMFEIGEVVRMIVDEDSDYTVVGIRNNGKHYDLRRNNDDLVFEYVSSDHIEPLKDQND